MLRSTKQLHFFYFEITFTTNQIKRFDLSSTWLKETTRIFKSDDASLATEATETF